MKLVLATRNPGKVRELAELLQDPARLKQDTSAGATLTADGWETSACEGFQAEGNGFVRKPCEQNPRLSEIEVIALKAYPEAPEVIEDGKTYAENAIKKASLISQYTGQLTLADDAGLEVNALNGAPGVNSKRWVGENATDVHRMERLLEALKGVTDRRARFVAALAVAHPDTAPDVVIGVCNGRIAYTPAGTSGFGYDPIFVPEGYAHTFAELGETVKNRISHRTKALQQALPLLQQKTQ